MIKWSVWNRGKCLDLGTAPGGEREVLDRVLRGNLGRFKKVATESYSVRAGSMAASAFGDEFDRVADNAADQRKDEAPETIPQQAANAVMPDLQEKLKQKDMVEALDGPVEPVGISPGSGVRSGRMSVTEPNRSNGPHNITINESADEMIHRAMKEFGAAGVSAQQAGDAMKEFGRTIQEAHQLREQIMGRTRRAVLKQKDDHELAKALHGELKKRGLSPTGRTLPCVGCGGPQRLRSDGTPNCDKCSPLPDSPAPWTGDILKQVQENAQKMFDDGANQQKKCPHSRMQRHYSQERQSEQFKCLDCSMGIVLNDHQLRRFRYPYEVENYVRGIL